MKGYIYKYTFPNGKVYIGQSRRRPNERNREHFDKIVGELNPEFRKAYDATGMPDFEILEVVEDEKVQVLVPAVYEEIDYNFNNGIFWVQDQNLVHILNRQETMYIQKYKATDPEFGYNVRDRAFVAVPKDAVFDDVAENLFKRKMEQWQSACEIVLTKCLETFKPLTQEELIFCDGVDDLMDSIYDLHFDFKDLKSNTDEVMFFLEEVADVFEDIRCDSFKQEANDFIIQNDEKLIELRNFLSILAVDK